jgi:hypothetical protein
LIFEILRGLKPIRGEIRREFEIQVVNEKRGSINFINPRFFVFCLLENFKETKILSQHFYKIVVYLFKRREVLAKCFSALP